MKSRAALAAAPHEYAACVAIQRIWRGHAARALIAWLKWVASRSF
jgi:hypothetical protein